jgi:hypothetical protein
MKNITIITLAWKRYEISKIVFYNFFKIKKELKRWGEVIEEAYSGG